MRLVHTNRERDIDQNELSDNVRRIVSDRFMESSLPKELEVPVEAQLIHVKLQGEDCTKLLFRDGYIMYKGIHHLPPNLKVRWKLSRVTEDGKIFAAQEFYIKDNPHVLCIAHGHEDKPNTDLEITLSFLEDEIEIGDLGKLEKPLVDIDGKLAAANLQALTRWEIKARAEEIRKLVEIALGRTKRRLPKK